MQKFHEEVKDRIVSIEYWWSKRIDADFTGKSVTFQRIVTHTPAMTICVITDKEGGHYAGMSIQNPKDDFNRAIAEATALGAVEKCMAMRPPFPLILIYDFPAGVSSLAFLDQRRRRATALWRAFRGVEYNAKRDLYEFSIDTDSQGFRDYAKSIDPFYMLRGLAKRSATASGMDLYGIDFGMPDDSLVTACRKFQWRMFK